RLKVLSDPGKKARPERQRVFRLFRQPPQPWDSPEPRATLPPPQPSRLPPFYGDGFGEYSRIAIDELALTWTQYEQLRRWAEGDFEPGEPAVPPARLEDLPLAEQPRALDRTPLEDCLGGPFHPGIELTWPMRRPTMWRAPKDAGGLLYRLNILPPGESPKDDYGAVLTPQACLGPDGPLTASGPGSLSRWLGVPWQTDEASCLNGYDVSDYLPVPSFWAARVPNEVLSRHAFDQATHTGLPYAQRFRQLCYRQWWLRDLQGAGYQDRINNMVKFWHLLGLAVEQTVEQPASPAEPGFPERYWVETGRSRKFSDADPTWRQLLLVEGLEPEEQRTDRLRKAAMPVEVLAEERKQEPEEIVHPLRRDVRRDQR
ncbi:MAG: LodA/GoxA family CTQ-dependent oxidase, partial [Acidobacteriota bacterium]